MIHIKELSKQICDKIAPSQPSGSEAENYVHQRIAWYMNDVFKVIKNINDTSLDKIDRAKRLIELEEKYGIPKTHNIL